MAIQENDHSNPTMTFTWNASKTPVKAKAFAVKRKGKTNPITFTATHSSEKPSNSSDNVPRLIKRKKKKDLQISQRVADDDVDEFDFDVTKQQNARVKWNKAHNLFDNRFKRTYVDSTSGKSVKEKLFAEAGKKFSNIGIHKHIVSNLNKHGFEAMTTVQAKSIPVILSGRDTLIRSQTGSGKTLAYAVPIINALQSITPRIKREDGVQAVVVVPTRELALQTHEHFSKINTFQWIVVGHLCGGENRKTEKDRLRKGVHVLIGSPGRLLDHVLHTSSLKLDKVRCLVLDEADRLLDMGFRKDIIKLVEEIDKSKQNSTYDPMTLLKSSKPTTSNSQTTTTLDIQPLLDPTTLNRQTILLSATLTKSVIELADFATNESHVHVDALDDPSLIPVNSLVIPETVEQRFVVTYVKHRLFTLAALVAEVCRTESKAFVFMASGQMVDYHLELFRRYLVLMPRNRGKENVGELVVTEDGELGLAEEEEEVVLDVELFGLHGSMDQKSRKEVFDGFMKAKKGVLFCTDVAARGLDVPEADYIIQYNGPQTDDDYLHRVGRTGRAGKSGKALIFLTHEEQEYVTRLQDHKVFLKKLDQTKLLRNLCDLMHERDVETAATALQRRFETAVAKDRQLRRAASFAYSSWSRFYNTYPAAMRQIFDFKKVNLGHYVTSFALRETPSTVARVVRGEVKTIEQPRLNKKLSIHGSEDERAAARKQKQKSISLATSEYDSGLEPAKKKKKKNKQ